MPYEGRLLFGVRPDVDPKSENPPISDTGIISLFSDLSRVVLPASLRKELLGCPAVRSLVDVLARGREFRISFSGGSPTLSLNSVYHSSLRNYGQLENFEPEVLTILKDILQPGMSAVDVGAHVGIHSYFMSSRVGASGMVYAFEPDARNVVHLQRSIRMNPDHSLQLFPGALSDVSGMAELWSYGGTSTTRVRTTHRSSASELGGWRYVPSWTLDDLVSQGRVRPPQVVKIDVEGHEAAVLRGMAGTIVKFKPAIICEIHPHLSVEADSVRGILERHGYTLRTLEPDTPNGRLPRANTKLFAT